MRLASPLSALLAATLALGLVAATPGEPADADTSPDLLDRTLDRVDDVTDRAADLVEPLVPAGVEAVVRHATEPLRTVDCREPFVYEEGIGCVRQLTHELLEVVGPDGQVATSHGHDHAPTEAAGSTAGDRLPSNRRPVVCAPAGEARTVVLYAHVRGRADRRGDVQGTIRRTLERSNQAVADSARRSGGPVADLRMRCDGNGRIHVASLAVPSTNFADVKAAAAAAGHDANHEKYLIFGDFDPSGRNLAGIADLFLDDRRSESNLNNGRRAMYGLVYGQRYFTGPTALHELAHTMGAVQPSAPGADGQGHCSVGQDHMCYPITTNRCGSAVFDCGNDSYFSTSTRPGQYLHSHWNLGWEGNRFIHVQGVSRASTLAFRDISETPHRAAIERVAEAGIAGGYSDGTYRPGRAVDRGQMSAFLQRARGLSRHTPQGFSDVRGTPHERDIGAVTFHDIARGFPDGTFRPRGAVSRGQMATFLARAYDLPRARSSGFSDVRGNPHEAAIDAVARAGIAEGYGDGRFRPGAPVTRGQMATFLDRAARR